MATKTNSAVGRGFEIGGASTAQIPYLGGTLAALLLLSSLGVPFLTAFVLCTTTFGTWLGVTGNHPERIWDELRKPRNWITLAPNFERNTAGVPQLPPMEKTYMAKRGNQKIELHGIEPEFHLNCYGAFTHGDLSPLEAPGFYLMSRGPDIKIVSAWELEGQSPSLSEAEAQEVYEAFILVLRNMPQCTARFVFESYSAEQKCIDEVDRLINKHERDELEYLILRSQKQRFLDMSRSGRIQEKRILLFATFDVLSGATGRPEGILEQLIAKLQPILNRLSGEASQESWSKALSTGYEFGFSAMQTLLDNSRKFKLKARPLNANELWRRDWGQLHKESPPDIPQLLIVNEDGLQEVQVNTQMHALGVLFSSERGVESVPKMSGHVLYRPVYRDFQGFFGFERVRAYPDSKGENLGQISYIWENLSDIPNSQYIVDITPDTPGTERFILDRGIKNSVTRMADAEKKGARDPSAEKRFNLTVEALDLADEGEGFYFVSSGFWVTRRSPQDIDQVIDRLARLVNGKRESYSTEYRWLQSQPFSWEPIGQKPIYSRQKYAAQDVVGLVPHLKVQPIDKLGLSLFTRDGTPLFLDLAESKQHFSIYATTRGGKSIALAEIIMLFKLNRFPVLVQDFPPPSGESTFFDLCQTIQELGGSAAYYNVRQESMNILGKPDLTHFVSDSDRYDASLRMIEGFHLDVLTLLVLGTERDHLSRTVTSILAQLYRAFMDDDDIQHRYWVAIAGGFGTQDYDAMPTLQTFLEFAIPWVDQYLQSSLSTFSQTQAACDQIITQLKGVLASPLGTAIGRASTINSDVDLLVVAVSDSQNGDFDAAVYSLAGYGALVFKALSSQSSAFVNDEGSIMFKNEIYARRAGAIAANGLKWGCHLILGAQSVESIAESVAKTDILNNMRATAIGYHVDRATQAFISHVNAKSHLIHQYASDSLRPNLANRQSYWLLKVGSTQVEVTYTASDILLALTANNPEEIAARRRYLNSYTDPVEALFYFARDYTNATKTNQDLNTLYPDVSLKLPRLSVAGSN